MGANIRINIDPAQKILLRRYLNSNGQAQIKFTKEVVKQANNYVPLDTGRLKDMSIELKPNRIIYNAPYAKKAYYTNKGTGKQGTSRGGLRGKQWIKRMWTQKGDGIVRTIAEFCGGRT